MAAAAAETEEKARWVFGRTGWDEGRAQAGIGALHLFYSVFTLGVGREVVKERLHLVMEVRLEILDSGWEGAARERLAHRIDVRPLPLCSAKKIRAVRLRVYPDAVRYVYVGLQPASGVGEKRDEVCPVPAVKYRDVRAACRVHRGD